MSRVLIFLIIVDFVFSVVKQAWIYTRPYDHTLFSEIYSGSQYVLGQNAKRSIGDDGLYPFAGYYYITGGDPSQVNFENPTLGKYLIGFSALVLGNENRIYLLYAGFILYLVFHLAKQLFNNKNIALCCVLLLEISPFFKLQFIPTSKEQLSIALLDLPLVLFFTAGIYFFLSAFKNQKLYFISSLFLAFAFVTKFFPGLIILLPVFFGFLLYKKRPIKIWIFSLTAIPLVYLLSYTAYFYYHLSLLEFLRYQKWIIEWRLGNPFVVGNIFRTILTGSYMNWWDGGVVIDHEWTLFFAGIVLTGIAGAVVTLVKKERELMLLASIVVVYIAYLALNTVGVARYILLIYPVLAILCVRFLLFFFAIMKQWNKILKR